ncbi:hypothetical protein POM88_018094 [Heracleum sosnowskyi]|uniref:Uncharacterized protein n=1 Tax=Heracleum sosnowskyi TaxID=360622 RepID=A0AAD8IQQ2_9APIA|nr:hypothetical protein POM88_018094 [Heracleum sosnowskyi]
MLRRLFASNVLVSRLKGFGVEIGSDEEWRNNLSNNEACSIKKSRTERISKRNSDFVWRSKIDLDAAQNKVSKSVIIKSINFGDGETRTPVHSISFKDQDNEPTIMQSVGSVRMLEGSVSFKSGDEEIMNSLNASFSEKNLSMSCEGEISKQSERSDSFTEKITRSSILSSSNPKHHAAIKLQKVYKSFRTRRKLADCAVLIEQSWWNILDFAELKHSSVSFFDIEKHETAISRGQKAYHRIIKHVNLLYSTSSRLLIHDIVMGTIFTFTTLNGYILKGYVNRP